MSSTETRLALYLHLARAGRMRQQPLERDKLLVLAGVTAAEMGLGPIAAYCRHRVLQHNPQHLLSRWPTIDHALLDEEFGAYLKQLQRRFPHEKCEHMLDSLGLDMARERETYFSQYDYAAALLGTTPEKLETLFDENFMLCETPGETPAGEMPTREEPATTARAVLGRGAPWWKILCWKVLWWPVLLVVILAGTFLLLWRFVVRRFRSE